VRLVFPLVNLIDGEVLRINVGLQARLKWSTDAAQAIPDDASEEGVLLDLKSTSKAAQTVISIADETVWIISDYLSDLTSRISCHLPSYEVFRIAAELLVRREVQMPWPVHNLAVGVMRFIGTERRPANEAFKHDGTNGPPIAAIVVALAAEDFRGNVIRSTDRGVCELTTRFTPGIDLLAVANGQLNLVQVHRIPVVTARLVLATR
jgi:hypothetical protein